MKLGFINFSSEEQLKMHQVIQAIQEHQAIDELGLGRIRDAFSNKLFPGISTLHNRAKYYAILPSLFLEAEKGTYKSANEVRAKVLNLEIMLTRQLLRGTEPANNWGITGSSVIDAAEAENSFSIKVPIVVPKVVFKSTFGTTISTFSIDFIQSIGRFYAYFIQSIGQKENQPL